MATHFDKSTRHLKKFKRVKLLTKQFKKNFKVRYEGTSTFFIIETLNALLKNILKSQILELNF